MCFKMRRASTCDYMVVQILVHLHFELVSSLLALDAIEVVFQPVTQMAVEMINIHLISIQEKLHFLMLQPQQTNFEMVLK